MQPYILVASTRVYWGYKMIYDLGIRRGERFDGIGDLGKREEIVKLTTLFLKRVTVAAGLFFVKSYTTYRGSPLVYRNENTRGEIGPNVGGGHDECGTLRARVVVGAL